MPNHIVIDGRPLAVLHGGITRYTVEIISRLSLNSKAKLTVITNKGIHPNHCLPAQARIFVDKHWSATLPGTIWMQLRVPTLINRICATHFLGTAHVLPVFGCKHIKMGLLVHDLVYKKCPETMSSVNKIFSPLLFEASFARADHIFSVSRTTDRDLRQALKELPLSTSICYPGKSYLSLGPDFTHNRHRPDKPSLLFVGSIEPRKNLACLVEAFLKLQIISPGVSLVIATNNRWGNALTDRQKSLIHVNKSISVHQGLEDRELDLLYRSANFLVIPSRYEGFGLPILEAIGKCAIIANDIPIFREISHHVSNMHFIDFNAPIDDVALSLADVLASNLGCRSAEDHEFFTWEKATKIIDNFLLA